MTDEEYDELRVRGPLPADHFQSSGTGRKLTEEEEGAIDAFVKRTMKRKEHNHE